MPTILAFGNSHIGPFVKGHRSLRAKGQLGCDIHGLTIEAERYQPSVLFEDGRIVFNPNIIEDTCEAIRKTAPICLVSTVMSSHHWQAGLVHDARPYDFVVPSLPQHGKSPGTELIPFDLVVRRARGDADWQFGWVRAIRKFCDLPIFVIEAPPPVQSAELILQNVLPHVRDAMAELGCPSVAFRYKIWWLVTAAIKQFCSELGFISLKRRRKHATNRGF